jgi:hypothetical protein
MDREARNALIRAHQNNVNRYCRLLATHLTDVEREYLHKRIVEEQKQLEKLLKPPRPCKSSTKAILAAERQDRHSDIPAS